MLGALVFILFPLVLFLFYITQRVALGLSHKEVLTSIRDLYIQGINLRE